MRVKYIQNEITKVHTIKASTGVSVLIGMLKSSQIHRALDSTVIGCEPEEVLWSAAPAPHAVRATGSKRT